MYDKKLITFLAAVKYGSFTKAASSQGMTVVAAKKQIDQLESELGLRLFTRSHSGVKLTVGGEEIASAAKRIVKYSQKEIKKATQLEREIDRPIIIGASKLCPCDELIAVWQRVSSQHPEFTVEVVPFEENHTETLTSLRSDKTTFDLIMTPCDSARWRRNVSLLQFGATNFCVSVGLNHRLARKKSLDLRELDGETIMLSDAGDSPIISQLRADIAKVCPHAMLVATPFFYDMEVFNHAVESGAVLMSLDFWHGANPLVVDIPLTKRYAVPYGAIYSRHASGQTRRFVKIIQAELAKLK